MCVPTRAGRTPGVLAACLVCCLGVTEVAARAPFSGHLRDAIKLNKERAPRYASLTDGRSRKISRRMIFLERLTLPIAKLFEWRAKKYQRAGVPLLFEEFVSMDRTPRFSERLSSLPPPLQAFVPSDGRAIARRIRAGYKQARWSGVSRVTEQELGKLGASGPHHAMLRHMLESIARVAHLAPRHSRLARDKGLRPTDTFSWRLVQLHLLSLPSFAKLDRWAAPLQSRGVPILYQDVPRIPLSSDFYDRPVGGGAPPAPR